MTAKDDMRKIMDQLAKEMGEVEVKEVDDQGNVKEFTTDGKRKLTEDGVDDSSNVAARKWDDFASEIMMTREEWSEINRLLSGLSLQLGMPRSKENQAKIPELRNRVKAAQDMMSAIHQRGNPE